MGWSPVVEICADSVAACRAAAQGGAARVELCAALSEGGLTPSAGLIAAARTAFPGTLHVLIRPRAGDFLYDETEFALMQADILHCKSAGVDGVVVGLLQADGTVDVERTRALAVLASPMTVVFHRAFDLARDPLAALEAVIAAGCDALLTSGQAADAMAGAACIAALVAAAGDRLQVMAGAGITPDNVAALCRLTGAPAYHASARAPVSSGMRFVRQGIAMGARDDQTRLETSATRVAGIVSALSSVSWASVNQTLPGSRADSAGS